MSIEHSPPAKNTRSQIAADLISLPRVQLPAELTGTRGPRLNPDQEVRENRKRQPPYDFIMPHSSQVISLRDAVEVVPLFSGRNIPLGQFIEGCEEARLMLPPESESSLAKLICTRLTGEARRSSYGQRFNNVNDVITFFEEIYAPSKTLHQLYGELGGVYQFVDEDVITYLNRVRDIGKQIADAYRLEHNGIIDDAYAVQSERDLTRYFIRGLKQEIRQGMGTLRNMKEARKRAVDLERDLLDLEALRRTPTRKERTEDSILNRARGQPPRDRAERVNYIRMEPNACQICKRQGHLANVCQYRFQQPDRNGISAREPHNPRYSGPPPPRMNERYPEPRRVQTSRPQQEFHFFREQPMRCQLCNKSGHTADRCWSFPQNPNRPCLRENSPNTYRRNLDRNNGVTWNDASNHRQERRQTEYQPSSSQSRPTRYSNETDRRYRERGQGNRNDGNREYSRDRGNWEQGEFTRSGNENRLPETGASRETNTQRPTRPVMTFMTNEENPTPLEVPESI